MYRANGFVRIAVFNYPEVQLSSLYSRRCIIGFAEIASIWIHTAAAVDGKYREKVRGGIGATAFTIAARRRGSATTLSICAFALFLYIYIYTQHFAMYC